MNIFQLVGIGCGMTFGVALALIANKGIRAKIDSRLPWCAEHPRGYIAIVVIAALLVLLVLYLISMRYL